MAATLGHEIEHTTPENIKLQEERRAAGENPSNTSSEQDPEEQEPCKVYEIIVDEYQELNSK